MKITTRIKLMQTEYLQGKGSFDQKGFTLVEALMSIVIIGIAVLPLLVVLSNLLLGSAVNEFSEVSAMLAEKELARVASSRFDAVVDEGPTAYSGVYADYTHQITISAVPAVLAANCASVAECKQVDISIVHASGIEVVVTTYKASV